MITLTLLKTITFGRHSAALCRKTHQRDHIELLYSLYPAAALLKCEGVANNLMHAAVIHGIQILP
jgi:hypothetical protein